MFCFEKKNSIIYIFLQNFMMSKYEKYVAYLTEYYHSNIEWQTGKRADKQTTKKGARCENKLWPRVLEKTDRWSNAQTDQLMDSLVIYRTKEKWQSTKLDREIQGVCMVGWSWKPDFRNRHLATIIVDQHRQKPICLKGNVPMTTSTSSVRSPPPPCFFMGGGQFAIDRFNKKI